MAAGRGEFFRSLWECVERRPAHPAPLRQWPGPGPGPSRGGPDPGGLPHPGPAGGSREKRPKAPPGSGSGARARGDTEQATFPARNASVGGENYLGRLPSEILIKILSYLDASSLFSISHVSNLLHQLSNDSVMWQRIYVSAFGTQMWKPKLGDAAVKEAPADVEDQSAGHWKKMYFQAVTGQEVNKWRRELKYICPYTGLPKLTEQVLRKLNVSWDLRVCDSWGSKHMLEQSQVYFFESSVIVHWNAVGFLHYNRISNIQIHGVRKETVKSPNAKKPEWPSLILNLDVKPHLGRVMGKDRLIKMIHLQPGLIIGTWRGQGSVAFIMVSLHFHKLVEKSVLGSSVVLYTEAVDRPPVDNSDPEFGLHGYSLHFVLHSTGTEIMLGNFRNLSCHTAQIQRGRVELRVIKRTDLSQHRALSGNINLPWKSEELEGSVENCCIMTLTLQDICERPFWCVSSPVTVTMVRKPLSFDYSGDYYLMRHCHPDGEVKMELVWLKEQKQFFLISLTLYICVRAC